MIRHRTRFSGTSYAAVALAVVGALVPTSCGKWDDDRGSRCVLSLYGSNTGTPPQISGFGNVGLGAIECLRMCFDGDRTADPRSVTWVSDDPSIASLSADFGLEVEVKGAAPGETIVRASALGMTMQHPITVLPFAASSSPCTGFH